jgi:HD-like signal output (HDOD) protein
MSAAPAKSITQSVISELPDNQAASLKILLDRGIKVPPQPRIATLFKNSVGRGERDVRALARLLSDDPGIVGMLFRLGRSPAYKQYQPFETVEQVLQAIGLKEAVNYVQALALASAFPKSNAPAFEAYWARSRAIAQLAMLVAEFRFGDTDFAADQAYLAGIFHDCGVPVLLQRFPNYCEAMALNAPGKWVEIEQEDKKFFADHAVVGYLVGRHWAMPEEVCAVIRFHHDLRSTTPASAQPLVGIIQYAVELFHRDRRVENRDWKQQREGVYEALHFSSPEHEQSCADQIFVAYDAMN